jgi:hypothetical protein
MLRAARALGADPRTARQSDLKPLFVFVAVCLFGLVADPPVLATEQVIAVIVGAPGAAEYEEQFHAWADRWRQAAEASGGQYIEFGREPSETSDREAIQSLVAQVPASRQPLWLVLIGHGTHYRDVTKFNLRGPDLSATQLNEWLLAAQRPVVVINSASSSGPFVNKLSAANRVVITATKSGAEQNFARFGDFISRAITDPTADLDHDDRVSLPEAYLSASVQTAKFYEADDRLATEHPLLDDNGDGLGTPATFYRGIRAVRSAKEGAQVDGSLAARIGLKPSAGQDKFTDEQHAELAAIEQQIESLRSTKAQTEEDAYYGKLETLMVQLARLYESVE